VRDIGVAEDLAHDALVAAMEQWPEAGVPRNPGAWLMAAAKNPRSTISAGASCSSASTRSSATPSHSNSGVGRIAALYDALARVAPSPVVELNRAVAVGMAAGPRAGLDLVDTLTAAPSLESYHLLPSVRGDFLFKLGRLEEARSEFERASSLTRNTRERELLLDRARACS
jgi:predicted RNA polymerase sigma factor